MDNRKATINIVNNTPYIFVNIGEEATHGRFITEPPSEIDDAEEYFVVENDSNRYIGPKGYVAYNVKDSDDNNKILGTLTIAWNHPFSGASSLYTAEPADGAEKYISVGAATVTGGHTQTATLTVNSI